MQLNTKQVRAIVNPIAGFGAQYTDRTVEDKASKRRSIVWHFYGLTAADDTFKQVQETFAKMGVTNKVTRTGTEGNWATHTSGGEYVRIIADIA